VINAPIFGGALGMRIGGVNLDDRMLDVLAFEEVPLPRIGDFEVVGEALHVVTPLDFQDVDD
jgi:hypothetical protein